MNDAQLQSYYDQAPSARRMVLVSVGLVMMLCSLALSSVNIAVPNIAEDLQASAMAVSWIPVAMLWGNVVFLLPIGRLADMVGRKRMFVTGMVLFILSSLCILLPQSINSLLLIRVAQGISSSMVYGTSMAIIGVVYANSNRGQALGIGASSVYFGLTLGPLVGGWLTEHWGWASVFWAPIPVLVLCLVVLFVFVKGDWKSSVKAQFDWQGSLIFAAWVTAFMLGLSRLTDWRFALLAVFGLLLLVAFVWHQSKVESPLLRLSALRANRIFNRSLLSAFFIYGSSFSMIFLLSLYLQYIHNLSPSEAGQIILIQTLIMMVLAPITGRLSDRFEPRVLSTFGCLLFVMGYAMLFRLDMNTSLHYVMLALVLLGLGFGFFSSPNNNAAIGSVPADKLSIAAALLNLARTMGNMVSSAIVMTLFSVTMGGAAITAEIYPQLLLVIKITMGLSVCYAFIAAVFSYRRGTIH
ncbi:MAG: MFS transporter [Gammaproteobacteria bacterium]|nr:MFS transporter [Gammaproteobacteria bacterium]